MGILKGQFIETESTMMIAKAGGQEKKRGNGQRSLKWELNEINLAQYLPHNKTLLNINHYLPIIATK